MNLSVRIHDFIGERCIAAEKIHNEDRRGEMAKTGKVHSLILTKLYDMHGVNYGIISPKFFWILVLFVSL